MGEAAVAVARGCDYVNAGTVEFLYEDEGFYYLEMNTRLQVEHCVTELISGVDLVEWQLRVAAGEPLPLTQDQVELRGHAIECRINAEDPAGGRFLPSPGPIHRLHVASGYGVRWDGGYEAGDEISQYYDNLVGKLCVWGKDRPTAIARMIRALEETTIEGVATTIPADLAILRHPDFAALEHSTKWVESTLDLSGVTADRGPAVEADGEAKVRRDLDVEVNGKRFSVSLWVPEGAAVAAPAAAGGLKRARPKRTAAASSGGAASGSITVPMQGTIVKVLVAQGDTVAEGDTICVLEAMKMENNIVAPTAGTVTKLAVEQGQSVAAGDLVATVE
jgi:acetyl-CoA/propionyl-CoA carboxylase biotin carboxyl carrier protein